MDTTPKSAATPGQGPADTINGAEAFSDASTDAQWTKSADALGADQQTLWSKLTHWKGFAFAGVLGACATTGGVLAWQAGLFAAAPSPAEAAVTEAEGVLARRAEFEAFTEDYLRQTVEEVPVGRGESLNALLTRAGVSSSEASAAATALNDVYDPRRLRPGQMVNLALANTGVDGDAPRLTALSLRSEPGASVAISLNADGGFSAREVLMPLTFEIARIASHVENSLYASALALGATDREVAALADAFSYDVDFQRDVQPGDAFELLFERFYDDGGETVRTGDLLFVSLETRNGPRQFYSFRAPGDSQPDWYDKDGKSARRFLMKTPINGARLSSSYGMRRHPVLGYSRMHRGTDFAAVRGTPIMAAGDGVVVRAGPYGSFGNYVRIRHANGYETAYAHMSRFGRGVRSGTRVHQGQTIGYVGTTGRSTGPHLHYEILRNGHQINPSSVRNATGRNLEGRAQELFEVERARIDRLREVRAEEAPVEAVGDNAAAMTEHLR